jgi:hypothetical protein
MRRTIHIEVDRNLGCIACLPGLSLQFRTPKIADEVSEIMQEQNQGKTNLSKACAPTAIVTADNPRVATSSGSLNQRSGNSCPAVKDS